MDANDPERGGGITEQAHIKLLRTLTSEGPDLQKKRLGFSGCQPPTSRTMVLHSHGHCLKVTFVSLKRFVKENHSQLIMQSFP